VTDNWKRDRVEPDASCSLGFDLDDPAVRKACAARDIPAIFRRMGACGLSQRQLARRVGMSESEVSEILAGRTVKSYDVFVRIAEGLAIPRGMMGLATGEHHEPARESYVDAEEQEAVKRRRLLSLGMLLAVQSPDWDQVKLERVQDMLLDPPAKVALVDVQVYEDAVTKLAGLFRRVGGLAARSPLVAMTTTGEQLLGAQMTPEVEQRLRYAVAEAHRLAAFSSGDVLLADACRSHTQRALDLAAGDRDRIAQVLVTVGSVEKAAGEVAHALDLFKLAQLSAVVSTDPQVGAVLASEAAPCYQMLGYPEKARQELDTSRQMFRDANPDVSLPCFAEYGNGHGALAAAEQLLGNYEAARIDGHAALDTRPVGDDRIRALDTVILATTNVRAGELRAGVTQANEALVLVQRVGSRRVRARLKPLAAALASRNDSTCRDLARTVSRVAV
jgi:transcriptional regulator with XRE-family HTH domain